MYIICIRNGKNTIDKIHSLIRTDQIFEDRHENHQNHKKFYNKIKQ